MVRNYVRQTDRGKTYSEDDINNAAQACREKTMSIRAAATHYKIPRSTLRHYLKGDRRMGQKGGGVISFLSKSAEDEIANCVKVMEKHGFGLSRQELLEIVAQYINQNNLKSRFKDGIPGSDWFQSFKQRHGLSLKKPQSIEHDRTDQANPFVIYDFFDVLDRIVKENNLLGKPGQFFNCDETSFCHDPSQTKIVGAIGVKSKRKVSSSGRENTTALLCCSADGKLLPTLCVFKGKHIMENWMAVEVSKIAISVSERGWMQTILFYNWFKDIFLPNCGSERPVLLIYDGHVTHVSAELLSLAMKNQIIIMKLPPKTTHLLQPCDVAVFRGLKDRWDRALCAWQRKNPRKKIPKCEFVRVLQDVTETLPAESIINGFRATGIYDPILQGPNRNAIDTILFDPSVLQRYKNILMKTGASEQNHPNIITEPVAAQQVHSDLLTQDAEQLLDNISVNEPVAIQQFHLNKVSQTETEQSLDNIDCTFDCLDDGGEASDMIDSVSVSVATKESSSIKRTFEETLLALMGKKHSPKKEISRKRLKTKNCEIITTPEYLKMKEDEEKTKEVAEKRKREKSEAKKKLSFLRKKPRPSLNSRKGPGCRKGTKLNSKEKVEDSSADEETGSIAPSEWQSHSESEEDDELALQPAKKQIGEYVAFIYEENYFAGEILHVDEDGPTIKALKRNGRLWKWPEQEDVLKYRWDDVLGHIREPSKFSSRREIFSIPELEKFI